MRNNRGKYDIEPLEQRVMLAGRQLTSFADGLTIGESIPVGDKLFFVGYRADTGGELWVTDGTPAGTRILKDIWQGEHPIYSSDVYSPAGYFTRLGSELFFTAYDGRSRGLWKSDGTPGGTLLVKSGDGQDLHDLQVVNRQIYMLRGSDRAGELWTSDGSSSGTVRVARTSGDIRYFSFAGTNLLFATEDDQFKYDLWRYDGAFRGSTEIASGLKDFAGLTSLGARVVFAALPATGATDDSDPVLWVSDGTASGTHQLSRDQNERPDFDSGAYLGRIASRAVKVGNRLFFTAYDRATGNDLWTSDGTPAGTRVVFDFDSVGTYAAKWLTNVDGKLFFGAYSRDDFGTEVFATDTTSFSTTKIDIGRGRVEDDFYLAHLYSQGDRVYFTADNGIWCTDGTAAGTRNIRYLSGVVAGVAADTIYVSDYVIPSGHLTGVNELFSRGTNSGAISGMVFDDENADGVWDSYGYATEPGLSRWRVYVDVNQNGSLDSGEPYGKTNSKGRFLFDDIPAGKYVLRLSRVSGYFPTTAQSYRVTVTALGTVVKRFGNAPSGSIIGSIGEPGNSQGFEGLLVYVDLNKNGVAEVDEPQARTAGYDGSFEFKGLAPGHYTVREVREPNYIAFSAESVDVFVTPIDRAIANFEVAPLSDLHVIRGVVFNDLNRNGVQEPGEPGLKNFRVWIDWYYENGVLDHDEPTTQTNSAGRYVQYLIATPFPHTFRIRLKAKGGWTSTTAKAFSFTLSQGTSSTKRFGVAAV